MLIAILYSLKMFCALNRLRDVIIIIIIIIIVIIIIIAGDTRSTPTVDSC